MSKPKEKKGRKPRIVKCAYVKCGKSFTTFHPKKKCCGTYQEKDSCTYKNFQLESKIKRDALKEVKARESKDMPYWKMDKPERDKWLRDREYEVNSCEGWLNG